MPKQLLLTILVNRGSSLPLCRCWRRGRLEWIPMHNAVVVADYPVHIFERAPVRGGRVENSVKVVPIEERKSAGEVRPTGVPRGRGGRGAIERKREKPVLLVLLGRSHRLAAAEEAKRVAIGGDIFHGVRRFRRRSCVCCGPASTSFVVVSVARSTRRRSGGGGGAGAAHYVAVCAFLESRHEHGDDKDAENYQEQADSAAGLALSGGGRVVDILVNVPVQTEVTRGNVFLAIRVVSCAIPIRGRTTSRHFTFHRCRGGRGGK
mmetsp:Transcript_14234/g.35312  ORF Transcript_14234/g.35312 Transcript_14234/m.35312 type:complete len:263 (+) Transcript_14234:1730-2518(+)